RAAMKELGLTCEAVRKNRENAKNWISFAFLPTMAATLLAPVLSAYSARHPDTAIRVFDSSIHEIPEFVESRTACFGVSTLQSVRGELTQQKIADEPFVLVCPQNHPFAIRKQVRWADLHAESLIRISLPYDNSTT